MQRTPPRKLGGGLPAGSAGSIANLNRRLEEQLTDALHSAEDWLFYIVDLLGLGIPTFSHALIRYLVAEVVHKVLLDPFLSVLQRCEGDSGFEEADMASRDTFSEEVDSPYRRSALEEASGTTISVIVSLYFVNQINTIFIEPSAAGLRISVLGALLHPMSVASREVCLKGSEQEQDKVRSKVDKMDALRSGENRFRRGFACVLRGEGCGESNSLEHRATLLAALVLLNACESGFGFIPPGTALSFEGSDLGSDAGENERGTSGLTLTALTDARIASMFGLWRAVDCKKRNKKGLLSSFRRFNITTKSKSKNTKGKDRHADKEADNAGMLTDPYVLDDDKLFTLWTREPALFTSSDPDSAERSVAGLVLRQRSVPEIPSSSGYADLEAEAEARVSEPILKRGPDSDDDDRETITNASASASASTSGPASSLFSSMLNVVQHPTEHPLTTLHLTMGCFWAQARTHFFLTQQKLVALEQQRRAAKAKGKDSISTKRRQSLQKGVGLSQLGEGGLVGNPNSSPNPDLTLTLTLSLTVTLTPNPTHTQMHQQKAAF